MDIQVKADRPPGRIGVKALDTIVTCELYRSAG
jgi:hypothetical protein